MLAGSRPAPGLKSQLPAVHGSADALALAEFATISKPLVIIAETAFDSERLVEEIKYFNPALVVHFFPDWETLPYDQFSPHQDLISERLATLYTLTQDRLDVLVIAATTALYPLPPPAFLAAYTFFLKQGAKLKLEALRAQFILAGYTNVSQVLAPGEFSIRGGLIDLFPMGSTLPYRLDLLDDEIESIRAFDVDTQRSIFPVPEVRLLPAREFPTDDAARVLFRQNFRLLFEGDPSKSRFYKEVGSGFIPAGAEYYLPLFFEHTATIFDYLPTHATLCLYHDIGKAVETFWQDTESRYRLLRGDYERPLLAPAKLFLSVDKFFAALKAFARVELLAPPADIPDPLTHPLPALQIDGRSEDPLLLLKKFRDTYAGRCLIVAESLGRRETMARLFAEHGLFPKPCDTFAEFMASHEPFMLGVGSVSHGFIAAVENFAVITETELYRSQVRQKRVRDSRRPSTEGILRDLSEVRIGDAVVHEQHGIGRYLGLCNLDLGEGPTEFLQLEYHQGDKLYVPVAQLYVISRYSGAAGDAAPLHTLGSSQWEKAKSRAIKAVRDTAAELLNLYAQRAKRKGHAFNIREQEYEKFAANFSFEETPDQAAAINAVMEDMRTGRPMDRLICGDVGFGKTEVALRAIFLAVADGKQAVVLVPTTLLAEQHFLNFSDRFAEWPFKIAELSRFRSGKEQLLTLKELAEGKVDIVIGTHRLIQKDVKFKNLGLVVIDEEHRFGVRQKEQLKALRAEVDVLTLTATPIPRTLSMSLEGLRDFSIIATAPQRRLSIKTFVNPYSEGIIREAVLRELKRGGQIYFLHNEVATIHNMLEKLEKLLPEARINIAHGQMREQELENVMRDFYHQRFNMLLCTTIIETGIDVPSANTILINRADKFGLAQLHQLRGRVGRSHHQAYAYLLISSHESLTKQASQRLEAIQMLEDLGAGFQLAMQDLEIRGAGEILGESQSGEMHEIGFNLYSEMLAGAVAALKEGKDVNIEMPLAVTTEINLHVPALLPEHYCADVHERLVIYKRMANCTRSEELDALHEELIDRFGLLPPPAKVLLETHHLRISAKPLGIAKIDANSEAIHFQFIPNPPIEAGKIIDLIQRQTNYKLHGPDKLKVLVKTPDAEQRIRQIQLVLDKLVS